MDIGYRMQDAGCELLTSGGDFEDCVADVKEAEDGWKEGCEFAKGNDLKE